MYENFKAVEEAAPDHPRKFTPPPHVEPREVFERGSKPFNSDAEPRRPNYRVVDQPSSGMLEAISKIKLQVERQIKTQKLPKAEIVSFDGNPLNYYLFIKRLRIVWRSVMRMAI